MQTIVIKTIPHSAQRYETVGDYYTAPLGEGGTPVRQFRISEMQNPDYEFLLAMHELIESHLVQKRGIPDAVIDDFDIAFEAERVKGYFQDEEPGDHPQAPYHREHQFASMIDRLVANELGVDYAAFNQAVMALSK
jgi:hypothetical protein